MTQIDWSKAPEGATHWQPENRILRASWIKQQDGGTFFRLPESVGGDWIRFHGSNRELGALIGRPVTWNGEGLPPVGLEVEVLWSSQCGTYVRGRVVAHDDGRAVFRFLDGERAGEYQAERVSTYNDGQFTNFRPIRTAEQTAAEEREQHRAKYVGELNKLWDADTKRSEFIEAAYALIVEAGAK